MNREQGTGTRFAQRQKACMQKAKGKRRGIGNRQQATGNRE
ncbi:MAG: hypothetical protein AB4426_35270 [Xenococcaceae cyanobacterium]